MPGALLSSEGLFVVAAVAHREGHGPNFLRVCVRLPPDETAGAGEQSFDVQYGVRSHVSPRCSFTLWRCHWAQAAVCPRRAGGRFMPGWETVTVQGVHHLPERLQWEACDTYAHLWFRQTFC